jgi:hypothetical protein
LPEVITLTPPPPAGLTPDNINHVLETIPSLCWQPVAVFVNGIPIATAVKYRLQISQRNDFLTFIESIDTEMNCWTPTSWYEQGIYYWRVATIDSAGNPGPYSPPAAFLLQYTTTTLVYPISGWVVQTPSFTWTAVPGAAYYRLEVATSTDFYPLYDFTITNNTHYTPLFAYPIEQIYYWRVGTYNADGYHSEFVSTQIAISSPRTWLPMISK